MGRGIKLTKMKLLVEDLQQIERLNISNDGAALSRTSRASKQAAAHQRAQAGRCGARILQGNDRRRLVQGIGVSIEIDKTNDADDRNHRPERQFAGKPVEELPYTGRKL